MQPDGNVAFKLTWVYGVRGPFTSSCTAEGRRLNIQVAKRVWCSQRKCLCFQVFKAGNTAPPVPIEDWPCNDSQALLDWRFSSGYFHHGKRKDQPIPMLGVRIGKLAFLTTRSFEMSERERIVMGCFRVSRVSDEEEEFWVEAEPGDERLRVKDLARAPRYWDYHKQTSGPRWGTGLFRYLPDSEAKRLYEAVSRAARR